MDRGTTCGLNKKAMALLNAQNLENGKAVVKSMYYEQDL